MNSHERLSELAKITGAPMPVVSVYLNTRWADEHQRDRVRIFLKNELARARESAPPRAADADLEWVEGQGELLVSQARFPDAHGVALFACQGLGLREALPVRIPFENHFAVAATPYLRPLSGFVEQAPAALVVFVDAESARLIPLDPAEPGEEVILDTALPRHNPGGWRQTVQGRYERYLEAHRERHFQAVAESLEALADSHGAQWVVLAGEPRNVGALQKSLPARLAGGVVGTVAAAHYESASDIVARAAELLARAQGQRQAEGLEGVLTAAAKSGQGVAGLDETLDAINRSAVQRLYLDERVSETGRACAGCGALARGSAAACPFCGGATKAVELAEAMSDRVLAAGGRVEVVHLHEGLARVGGAAALLRYRR